jgi:hypothetical protein
MFYKKNKKMTISYSLTSEIEPSDKQLDDLMKAVLQGAAHPKHW